MEVKGHSATVAYDGNFVVIKRKGFLARATVGKGEKKIPLKAISAIQWKPAGAIMNGYIEFSLGGGNESQSKFGRATKDATKNENAVIFTKKQMPEFQKLRNAVEAGITGNVSEVSATQSLGIADRIKELDSLFKSQLITGEEFKRKKEELLKQL